MHVCSVFTWGASQYVAVNGPPMQALSSPRTIRNMKIQRIFPSVGPAVDLDLVGSMERYEKNWAPIQPDPSNATRFLFARNVEPHQIVSCDMLGACSSTASSSQATFFETWSRLWKLRVRSPLLSLSLSPVGGSVAWACYTSTCEQALWFDSASCGTCTSCAVDKSSSARERIYMPGSNSRASVRGCVHVHS